MDIHLAQVDQDDLTHLTLDAGVTLCGVEVVELPEFASTYCSKCIEGEYVLQVLSPSSTPKSERKLV